MTIGTLGDVVFEVADNKVFTFDEFSRMGSAKWATHEILGQKEINEFISPNTEEISFNIKLSVFLGININDELKKLRNIRDTGEYNKLIIAGESIGENYWVISSLDEKVKSFDQKGNILIVDLGIKLSEYVDRIKDKENGD